MSTQKKIGTISDFRGSPRPNSYIITVQEDGEEKTYLCHLGNLKSVEDKIYELSNKGEVEILQKGDTVEFVPQSSEATALHVTKKQ